MLDTLKDMAKNGDLDWTYTSKDSCKKWVRSSINGYGRDKTYASIIDHAFDVGIIDINEAVALMWVVYP